MDVGHFVRSPDSCQETNTPEQTGPYGRMPVSGLFRTWSIDFSDPFKETATGNKYILLAVENLSSWPVASVIGTNYFNSSGVIKFVQEQVRQLDGNAIGILSESDPKFDSVAVRDYASNDRLIRR